MAEHHTVAVVAETVEENLAKLKAHIAKLEAVASTDLSHNTGASVGVTAPFHKAMSQVAIGLPGYVDNLRIALANSHDAIAQTVADLVALDTLAANDTIAMLDGLSSEISAMTSLVGGMDAASPSAHAPADAPVVAPIHTLT